MISLRRTWTMARRYLLLYLRSPARLLEVFFWPVMELLLWGFFSIFLRDSHRDPGGQLMLALLHALVFWDVLYRSQQGVSLAFMEELWTRNLLNVLISPVRTVEWVLGSCLYGLIKTLGIVGLLYLLAFLFYRFDPGALGFALIPFLANVLLMGWAIGLFTAGLLVRWGHSAEALIWGIPFLVQPFSAIFYPLSVYPNWLKPLCLTLPSTHVMEGMRTVLTTGVFPVDRLMYAFSLNAVFIFLGAFFYVHMMERGRSNGQLIRMTE